MRSQLAGAGVAVAVLLAGPAALAADRVAVLRFMASGGGTTSVQLDAARAAARSAVAQIHDELPTDAEMTKAEAEVKDGVADTSAEYRAAGRVASAQWTVAGHVDAHGWNYRLELEACQVSTGRVESLAREVDGRQATPQIAEMLALLLRPQGVGDTVPPWDQATPPPLPSQPPPTSTPPPTPPPTPTPTPTPTGPPPPAYAEGHPFGVGLGGEALLAFHRSGTAQRNPNADAPQPVSGVVTATGAYALDAFPGLELVANLGVAVAGPSSLGLDVGVRWELPIVRGLLYVGPEARFGALVFFGGDKDVRFTTRGALPIVVRVSERVQIEGYPEIALAAGGSATLGLAGGGLRGVLRF